MSPFEKKYFSYDGVEDSFRFHRTPEEARAAAGSAVGCARFADPDDRDSDGWPSGTGHICWGEISQLAYPVDTPVPPESREGGAATYAEYQLLDYPCL